MSCHLQSAAYARDKDHLLKRFSLSELADLPQRMPRLLSSHPSILGRSGSSPALRNSGQRESGSAIGTNVPINRPGALKRMTRCASLKLKHGIQSAQLGTLNLSTHGRRSRPLGLKQGDSMLRWVISRWPHGLLSMRASPPPLYPVTPPHSTKQVGICN